MKAARKWEIVDILYDIVLSLRDFLFCKIVKMFRSFLGRVYNFDVKVTEMGLIR